MSKLTTQVKINAPVDKVRGILADFGAIGKWAPPVSKSYSTTEARQGVGAGRHCDTSFGALNEQIVEWEEGHSFTIDGKTVLPMKYARNGFSVSPPGDGTVVTAFIDFQMKFGPVGALLDKLVLRRQFRKVMALGLGGLKYHSRDRRGGRHQASQKGSQRHVHCLSSPGTARCPA